MSIKEDFHQSGYRIVTEILRANGIFVQNRRVLRPDSTPAKFFVRTCLCEIQMVAHE